MCACSGNCSCGSSATVNSGLNGYNAFTKLMASFIQPAYGANVTISVDSSRPLTGDWAATGQIIFIENGGYYEVITEGTSSLVVKNLASATDYTSNAAVGATIVTGGRVSPSGSQSNEAPVVNITSAGTVVTSGNDNLPIGNTSGFVDFFSRNLDDYLTNVNDCVILEFIYTPFPYTTGQVDNTRISVNGTILHNIDNAAIDATNKVWYKLTIIRQNASQITYKSEFRMLSSNTASVNDQYPLVADAFIYHSNSVSITSFTTVEFLVEVDISTPGNSLLLEYLHITKLPLIPNT
jgi:hypothetical protein